MLKASVRYFIVVCLCLTGAGSAWAEQVEGVNYDDPNLAVSNDFVADNAASCPTTLKGKALKACLHRLGLTSSEVETGVAADVAQVTPRIVDDAAPLAPRRGRTAR